MPPVAFQLTNYNHIEYYILHTTVIEQVQLASSIPFLAIFQISFLIREGCVGLDLLCSITSKFCGDIPDISDSRQKMSCKIYGGVPCNLQIMEERLRSTTVQKEQCVREVVYKRQCIEEVVYRRSGVQQQYSVQQQQFSEEICDSY